MNEIIKNTLIMTAITLASGLCLGYVYDITKVPIAEQKEKAKQAANMEVFQGASSFEEEPSVLEKDSRTVLDEAGYPEQEITEVLAAKDEGGNTLGYVLSVTSHEGYGGDISFSMGVQNDGTVNGISILSISETAGLGMKADTDEFKSQFADKKVPLFTYTKTGASSDSEIDAISGATVTTNAVVNGVDAGLAYFQALTEGGAANE